MGVRLLKRNRLKPAYDKPKKAEEAVKPETKTKKTKKTKTEVVEAVPERVIPALPDGVVETKDEPGDRGYGLDPWNRSANLKLRKDYDPIKNPNPKVSE